jgi:hypothetical protein
MQNTKFSPAYKPKSWQIGARKIEAFPIFEGINRIRSLLLA